MKKIFVIATVVLFSTNIYSQGFIWNTKAEAHHKTYDRVALSRSAVLPTSVSLEKYLPYIQNQGTSDMCVAYSIATCRTIVYSRNNGITDIDKISAESYSPYYIYHRAKTTYGDESWDGGMMIYMNKINRFGYAKIKDVEYPYYYPFTNQTLWNFSIPSNINLDIKSVKEDKFDYIISILPTENAEDTVADLIHKIKIELAQERPIIFALATLPATWGPNLNGKDLWDPSLEISCEAKNEYGEYICSHKTNDISGLCSIHKKDDWEGGIGHAMVLIGYDDEKYGGAFQIVNSWGEDFGVGGKIWVRYKDFIENAVGLQALDKSNKKTIFDVDNSTDIFTNKKYTKESGLEIKDFMAATSYKWMIRVPIIGMDAGEYSGEKQDSVKNGKGTCILINGITYKGEWKDDKMHGQGIYTTNKFSYKGTFNQGNFDGEGVLTKLNKWGAIIEEKKGVFKDGNFIKGDVKIDFIRGYLAGFRYEGPWSDGAPNGNGILFFYSSKYDYEGGFRDFYFHGQGKLITNNYIYEGEWKDDMYHGQGTMTLPNGDKYVGEWKDNLKNGQGTYTLIDGTKYKGEFKNNMANGKGTMTWPNGNKYVGEFNDYYRHGQGTYTYKNGKIKEGRWYYDKFVKGKIILQIKIFFNNIF